MLEVADTLACWAVVPVFVNVGAALLPAIFALVASVFSLLLRPRDLWRFCKVKPWVTAVAVLAVAAVGCGAAWLISPSGAKAAQRGVGGRETAPAALGMPRIDWAAVARQWIRQDSAPAGAHQAPSPPLPQAGEGSSGKPFIFGGGPLRNGYLGGGSPCGLASLWEFPAPGTPAADDLSGAMYLASPALMGDAIYGGATSLDLQGKNYGTLFCLDAATGAMRWTTSGHKDAQGNDRDFRGIFSSPALTADGKYLVVGQGLHNDDRCGLLCVEAKTGRVHWQVETPLHIEGSPAIDGDLAVAGAGAIEVGDDHHAQGHPGLVVAVQVSTGRKLWEYQVNDPESSPAMADGVVYIGSGFNGKAVLALRTETDEQLQAKKLERIVWRTPTPHPATGAVTLTDDLVLVGCGNGDYVFTDRHPEGMVLALRRRTGEPCWQVKLPDAVLGKIAVQGRLAIVPVRSGEVVALDLNQSGRIVWRQRINGDKAALAGPAFTGTHVYAVSQDGCLAVLAATDGKVLEKHDLNARGKPGEMGLSLSSPLVAFGRVYVGSETGGLRSFVGKDLAAAGDWRIFRPQSLCLRVGPTPKNGPVPFSAATGVAKDSRP